MVGSENSVKLFAVNLVACNGLNVTVCENEIDGQTVGVVHSLRQQLPGNDCLRFCFFWSRWFGDHGNAGSGAFGSSRAGAGSAAHKARHEEILQSLNYTDYDITEVEKKWLEGIAYLKEFTLVDSEHEINNILKEGKSVLCEGAQGTMLDVDFGSYPFVTSSNTICAGACIGLGIGPNKIGDVFGIIKAYCTRVGAGPFPTELFDETGAQMRAIGHEYGAVTGRERRCGWIDLVALKYAIMVSGVTKLILMKSDVLDGFDTIKACTAYKLADGSVIDYFPYDISDGLIEPVYTELPGWKTDLTKMTSEAEFPQAFSDYIAFLEKELETPIAIVSVGPDRAQTIER